MSVHRRVRDRRKVRVQQPFLHEVAHPGACPERLAQADVGAVEEGRGARRLERQQGAHLRVQAIVGDLSRGTEEEHPRATRRDDGSWLIDGPLPLPELLATLGLPDDAADELPDIATAAGLVTALIGDLPTTGERTQWKGWRFEVVDLDGRRVDKLLVSPVPAPSSH